MIVNGIEKDFAEGITVSELLEKLSLDKTGYIVVVDLNVVLRSEYQNMALSRSSKVEIISVVGGG